MELIFNTNLDSAPIDKDLLLLFANGDIHTGVKKKKYWVKFPGTKKEVHGYFWEYSPSSVRATYDAEPYFCEDVIGYIELKNITYELNNI